MGVSRRGFLLPAAAHLFILSPLADLIKKVGQVTGRIRPKSQLRHVKPWHYIVDTVYFSILQSHWFHESLSSIHALHTSSETVPSRTISKHQLPRLLPTSTRMPNTPNPTMFNLTRAASQYQQPLLPPSQPHTCQQNALEQLLQQLQMYPLHCLQPSHTLGSSSIADDNMPLR